LATVSVARTSAGARSVQDRVEDRAEPHIGYTETYGGLNLEMVWIPRGTFPMGSRSAQAYSDEMPVHAVILDGFWLGKCEVTQRQYGALMGMNSSKFKGPNQPVENVSWNDAVEFCRKLSQATGKRYTLPTEAQWEYACRAGSTGEWCFGNDERALAGYAWYDMNSDGRTQDVGTKRANGWGLYDMHGNVWEWCADWYGPYTGGAQRNPAGPNTGTARVMRGGTWCHRPNHTRSALRSRNAPHRGHYGSGFRVCRVASP
jgi:formylglycine-generating enzyme required for sulfatase activity